MRGTCQDKHEYWRHILSSWRESGQKIAEYCRRQGISVWQFHYWKKRLLSISGTQTGDFVEMSFKSNVSGIGVRIEVGEGIYVHLERGFDELELKRTLKVLRQQY